MPKVSTLTLISDSLNKINKEREQAIFIKVQTAKNARDRSDRIKQELSNARKKFQEYIGEDDIYALIERKTKDGVVVFSNRKIRTFFSWDEINNLFEYTDNKYIIHANLSDAKKNEIDREFAQMKWVLQYLPQILIATSGKAKTPEELFNNLYTLGNIGNKFVETFQSSLINFILIINTIKNNLKYNIKY